MEIEARRPASAMTQDSIQGEPWRNVVAFWLLGLFNNAAFVIMIAGANEISAAAVGLVYLSAVAPAILCKATGPYWFHLVTYRLRMATVALLMACCYTTVALSSSRGWQLLGVMFASLQGGLGEASCLALSSYYRGRPVITAWSSGTGFAGVFGYTWVAVLHVLGGLSFRATLLLANVTPLAFLAVYYHLLLLPKRLPPGSSVLLHPGGSQRHTAAAGAAERGRSRLQGAGRGEAAPLVGGAAGADGASGEERSLVAAAATATGVASAEPRRGGRGIGWRPPSVEDTAAEAAMERQRLLDCSSGSGSSKAGGGAALAAAGELPLRQSQRQEAAAGGLGSESGGGDVEGWGSDSDGEDMAKASKAARMMWRERAVRTAALWPYTIPLVVVYFAEYAMQAGTWTAIGFPVTDAKARHTFYTYSNWCYQAGVFVSRSSGMIYQATRAELWAMPAMQVGWLVFFLVDAVHKFWYDYGLLVPCFITGLLGGAVYVNAFTLISKEVEPQHREFSMAAASLADSLGVALADATGILIQGCLFRANGLEGADFKC